MAKADYRLARPVWQTRAQRAWFRFCTVCLSIYIAYAAYLSKSALFVDGAHTVAALLCFAALSVGLNAVLTAACGRLCAVAPTPRPQRDRLDARVFWAALGICAVVFGCAFAACWPGGVSYDASNQWRQALSGEFINWHPLAHTLLIWLATRVTASYPTVVAVKISVFSESITYLAATLHKRGVPAWLALLVHAVTAVSLPVRNTLMYLGKDSAMTIGVLALTAQVVNILYTRGAWLQKPRNAVAFGVALAFATLMRHNAVLWTLPLLLCTLCGYARSRRGAGIAAACFAALCLLVQGPLYAALDVVYPVNTTEESVGIPMTILCDVRQQAPDKLDAQTAAFLNDLATEADWQSVYQPHTYNSIKFTYDREKITSRPVGDILGMALRTAQAAPRIAFEAVNGVTDLVWDLTGQNEGYETVRNSGDLESARYGRATLNSLGSAALAFLDAPMAFLPLQWLTQNIGAAFLLLLLVTLWALRRCGVSALMLALSPICYNLGTMLLLCGNDARFFQCAMAVSLPSVLALVYLPTQEEA